MPFPRFDFSGKAAYILPVFSGVLLALSFPLPGLSILAWGAFIPLLVATNKATPSGAFKYGFITGVTAYTGILYWLNIVMTTYGKLPFTVSLFLTFLMAAYLALFVAATSGLARLAECSGVHLAFAFPVFWIGLEYLREFLLTGFPWAALGYTQFRTLPVIQIADITGVYGISFLIVLANVVLFRVAQALRSSCGARYPFTSALILVTLLAGSVAYGFIKLNRPESGTIVKVALAQGNIPQDVKWDPLFKESTVAVYERLSRRSAGSGRDLVVWPESSLPFYLQEEKGYADRVYSLARELNSPLVVSSPAVDNVNGQLRYYNSAFLIGSDGKIIGRSDKNHLVPFGEYVPLSKLLPFVNKLVYGIGDFSPGSSVTPLQAPFGKIGLLVCFEGIFPELSREYVGKGARILVNITNDAWFGRSSAPYQHLSMTVFRAVENRVPLVRAANTGITAIIDSQGHIRGMTGLFDEALLTGEVSLGIDRTFYTEYGDLFARFCLLAGFVVIFFSFVKSGRNSNPAA